MKEHSALGMVGKFELPAGFEKMEGEIVWNSFYADVLKSQADIFTAYSLQCRSSWNCGAARDATGRPAGHLPDRTVQVVPLRRVQAARGRFLTTKFSCTYVKQVLDGQDILELDVLANIYKAGGRISFPITASTSEARS